ncbi:hypothetical protein [Actinocorallia libanotica]|uniref:Na+/H+ antiporter NhaC family protein n=1 Tax=Actinocorallia libanotica TaxID=46162 RepID=A0ABN1QH99_9ACTN
MPVTAVPPARRRVPPPAALLHWTIGAAGLIASLVLGFTVQAPTLWGFLPIGLFAVLALAGLNLPAATGVALVSGLLLARPAPGTAADLLAGSFTDTVTLIGVICVLGAGLGEVLSRSGAARLMVRAVLRLLPGEGLRAVQFGVVLSCLVLVFALGTLAGALAVAAPVVIPVAARAGLTRSATAVCMFLGGGAGLALAPFAGSNIATFEASGVGYGSYVLWGAGPLALLSLALAWIVVPRVQRRSAEAGGDFYEPLESSEKDGDGPAGHGRAAAWTFTAVLAVCVGYAVVTQVGVVFPLLALPLLAVVTAVAGRLGTRGASAAFGAGARRMLPMLLLFWLLALFFGLTGELRPYEVLMEQFGTELDGLPVLPFALTVALIGWLGVPGAAAAQIVLLDKVFGPLGTVVGLGPEAWAVVYLWSAKADTYGPFPNPNMMSALGMARSTRLRPLLAAGWALLVPAALLYVLILTALT